MKMGGGDYGSGGRTEAQPAKDFPQSQPPMDGGNLQNTKESGVATTPSNEAKDFPLTKPPMGGANLGQTGTECNGPAIGKCSGS